MVTSSSSMQMQLLRGGRGSAAGRGEATRSRRGGKIERELRVGGNTAEP